MEVEYGDARTEGSDAEDSKRRRYPRKGTQTQCAAEVDVVEDAN
jgi:hypothetical protein